MPSPLVNTPEALDAATASALQSRREKLLRIVESGGIRVRVAYACTAIVAICAVVSFFAGDRSAARTLGMETCVLLGFVVIATSAARSKALRELQKMKLST